MSTKLRKGSRPSRDGKTVGITLRLPVRVLSMYDEIASRANVIHVKRGGAGGVTAQEVMRHRLISLPALKNVQGEDDGKN